MGVCKVSGTSKGKPFVYELGEKFPVFNSILNSDMVPSVGQFLEMGKEFCDARIDSYIENAVLESPIEEKHNAHWLLKSSTNFAKYHHSDDYDIIGKLCNTIFMTNRWLHTRDQLRMSLTYLKNVWADVKKVNEDHVIEDTEPMMQDAFQDKKKKPRKRKVYGPRNTSEFSRFRTAIEKGLRKGQTKKEIALDFANGDEKKAARLLRRNDRHKALPE
jgi:hypothetical protein